MHVIAYTENERNQELGYRKLTSHFSFYEEIKLFVKFYSQDSVHFAGVALGTSIYKSEPSK
jgi:hypothetical protein